jgi:methionyl-tRNA formyltransferase
MTNVIFCGYRDWAIEIVDFISNHHRVNTCMVINSNTEFNEKIGNIEPQSVDIIIFIGWSWLITDDVTSKFLCLGIHPSDLPWYRGGSPLQHQIINGIKKTQISLMTLSNTKIDGGDIWMKHDLSLDGKNMKEVLKNLTISSIVLLTKFFDVFPILSPELQDISKGSYFKRRKPEDSRLELEDFKKKSLIEIYDFIRSLTDPYPNAYLEDEFGNKLLFKEVELIKNK